MPVTNARVEGGVRNADQRRQSGAAGRREQPVINMRKMRSGGNE